MNNVKLRNKAVMLAGIWVRGLPWARKPKHSPQELQNLRYMDTPARKRRSHNRKASWLARRARRVTRHGR